MSEPKAADVIAALVHMAQASAKGGNIFPQPACGRNGDHLDVIAFALNAKEIFITVHGIIKSNKYEEFAFGIDRVSRPGQGVDEKYTDVYTIFHHTGDGVWKYGVLPYNSSGEYGDVDWENTHWFVQMLKERLQMNILVEPTPKQHE